MLDAPHDGYSLDIDDFDVPVSIRNVELDGELGAYAAFNNAFYVEHDLATKPVSAEEIVSGEGYRLEEVDRRVVRTRRTQVMNVRRGDTMLTLRKRPIVRDDRVVAILTLSIDVTDTVSASNDREVLRLAADVMEMPLVVFAMLDGEMTPIFSNRASDALTAQLREEPGPRRQQATRKLHAQLSEVVASGQTGECNIELGDETHLMRDQPLVASTGAVTAVVRTGSEISAVIRANWSEHLLEIVGLESTDEAIERAFAVGCELLDLPAAIIAEVRGGQVVVSGNELAGIASSTTFPVTATFRDAIGAERAIMLRDLAAVQAGGPIIDLLKAKSMASVPILTDGDRWGVLAFSDTNVRSDRFSENSARLLEALGATLSLRLERDQARARLVPVELLQRSNRELAEYAYAAAHDLRSPLRAIRSFSEVLVDEVQSGDPDMVSVIDFAERVVDGAGRMDKLLSSMLDHAAAIDTDENMRSAVELDAVLAAVVTGLESAIDEALGEVTIRELPVVHGDFDQLQRVFANLIENALKYRHPDREPRIEVFAEADEATVDIHVRDNGLGVPAEHRDRIFGLFKRLSDDDAGTGVGLSVVRRIVEDYGGSLSVSSHELPGSDFVVQFPIFTEEQTDTST